MNLYFVNGNRQGEYLELIPPGICIGREADNDIQLLLPGISRYHARIEYSPDGDWKIVDLGSTNGTKIDGKRIDSPVLLESGMQIIIGEQILKYVAEKNEKATKKEALNFSVASSDNMTIRTAPEVKSKTPAGKSECAKISLDADIFGGTINSSKNVSNTENSKSQKNKRISNLLFLLLVVVLVCVALVIFTILQSPGKQEKKHLYAPYRMPLLIQYEKKIYSKNDVFRFYVKVEENQVVFQLDDLRFQRHFMKKIRQIDNDIMLTLSSAVRNTNFMKLQSEPEGLPQDGVDDLRTLTVGYDDNLNTVTVHNSYPKRSFQEVEQALDQFASDYGLKTISLSEEEMLKEADSSFAKAEELFSNYKARPENLRNAILRYQLVIDFLEQFEPKPEKYKTAQVRLSEAKKMLVQIKKDAQFQINVFYKRKQYADALAECNNLLLVLDPEDIAYQKIRNLKITLEKILSQNRKRGRK